MIFEFEKNKKAFTLIELLVVIAIIGFLATLSITSLNSARASSRDSRRVADVRQMQIALEMYMNDFGRYPHSFELPSSGQYLFSVPYKGVNYSLRIITPLAVNSPFWRPFISSSNGYYMMNPPIQPLPLDGACVGGNLGSNYYTYFIHPTEGYVIRFCVGKNVGSVKAGLNAATPAGITPWEN